VELQDLTLGYEGPLLKHVSARFTTGVTGIIGNNGRGKSTLLKAICGLLQPQFGKIIFNDRDLALMNNQERARTVSFTPSSNVITFPLTVHELVSMGRYPYVNQWAGLSPADEGIVARAIELCGMRPFKDKKVNTLSDGERQKVFIAKQLAQETPVMLLDEPTAFLDYSSKKYFFNLMKEVATERHKIVLISSHDIDFLTAYADHLLMIEDDETVVFGNTPEVVAADYFRKHFTR
jgi:iron complex transport system ATP-binding protein